MAKGGKGEISPCDAAKGSEFLICAATNFEEVSHSLFDGQAGAVEGTWLKGMICLQLNSH